jgi:hypothetical protein
MVVERPQLNYGCGDRAIRRSPALSAIAREGDCDFGAKKLRAAGSEMSEPDRVSDFFVWSGGFPFRAGA